MTGARRGRRVTSSARSSAADWVVPAAIAMLLLHLALRAWMLLPSWFFLDDFNLLHEGQREAPGFDYLMAPYNGHLMPGGRLIAWLVAETGLVNWPLAAAVTLLLQAASGAAMLWMLLVMFGRKPGVLALLAIFLTTSIAVPSFMWWAAALGLVPMQVSACVAIGAWIGFLRTRGAKWLVVATAAIAAGLFFWVKALLVVPVLAALALGWFEQSTSWKHPALLLRRFAVPAAVIGGLGAAYGWVYVMRTPDQFQATGDGGLGPLLETMVGEAFATAALGGPWQWSNLAPPTAYADPPAWMVHLSWAALSVTVLLIALRRSGTTKAWLLLVGYLAILVLLLQTSRAQDFGPQIGLEYRYLADASVVMVLALGLATMSMPGAARPSRSRRPTVLARPVPAAVVIAAVVFVAVGGVVSSVQYAQFWHRDNGAEQYLKTVQDELERHGRTDLADQVVPENVMSQLAAPSNNSSFLVPLVTPLADFPDSSASLAMLGDDGTLRQAQIGPGVRSRAGPVDECGWRVTEEGLTVPLDGLAFDYIWWLRIGYLYAEESEIVVSAGGDTNQASLQPGLNSLYVRLEGSFEEVRIDGVKPGTTMCVDTIEVGPAQPGGPL